MRESGPRQQRKRRRRAERPPARWIGRRGSAGSSGSAGAGGTAGTGGGAAGSGGRSGSAGTGGSATGQPAGAGAGGSAGSGGATAGSGGAAGTAPAVVIPGAGNCTPPTGANAADARAAYDKFKTDIVTSDGAGGFLRVRRPNSSGAVVNSTVSEGIAYGMLLAVYADDQPTFDKFWQYSQIHLDSNGLMNWYIGPAGETLGTGAASDSDEDIAFALIAADARWGGRGSLTTNYIDLAQDADRQASGNTRSTTRNDVFKPGDTGFDGSVINISYFAPAYYRCSAASPARPPTGTASPPPATTSSNATLNAQNGNASNGLVPAWSTPAGRADGARPAPATRFTTSSIPAARRSASRSTTAGTPSRARSPTCRRSTRSTPASARRPWSTATT